MASADGESGNHKTSGSPPGQTIVGPRSGLLCPRPLDLPPLVPASFRPSPAGLSVKPPPPPLLPYPPGGLPLPLPRLWPRLLRPGHLAAWGLTGGPDSTVLGAPLGCWLLPGPAPPLLPAGNLIESHYDRAVPLDEPGRQLRSLERAQEQAAVAKSQKDRADEQMVMTKSQLERVEERRVLKNSARKRRPNTDVFAEPEKKRSVGRAATVDQVPRDGVAFPCDALSDSQSPSLAGSDTRFPSGEVEVPENKPSRPYIDAEESSPDQNSKWFNPHDKDFNFSWGENLSLFQKQNMPEAFSGSANRQRSTSPESTGSSKPWSVAGRSSATLTATHGQEGARPSPTSASPSSGHHRTTRLKDGPPILHESHYVPVRHQKMSHASTNRSLQTAAKKYDLVHSRESEEVTSHGQGHVCSDEQKDVTDEITHKPTSDNNTTLTDTSSMPSTRSLQIDCNTTRICETKSPVPFENRRQKNNEAAKRSRDARRAKEDGVAVRCALLEAENVQLRLEMAWLKGETARLKYVLYSS